MQSTTENLLPAASAAGEVCVGDRKLCRGTESKAVLVSRGKVPEADGNKTVVRSKTSTHSENLTLTNSLGFTKLFSFIWELLQVKGDAFNKSASLSEFPEHTLTWQREVLGLKNQCDPVIS